MSAVVKEVALRRISNSKWADSAGVFWCVSGCGCRKKRNTKLDVREKLVLLLSVSLP